MARQLPPKTKEESGKKTISKREPVYLGNIKEIIAVATAFITLVVALGGGKITQVFSEGVKLGVFFTIIISIAIAMIVSYIITHAYHSPKSFITKIGRYSDYAPAILSIVAGLLVIYVMLPSKSVESNNLVGILQYGIYFGLGVGILLGIAGHVATIFTVKKLGILVDYSEKMKPENYLATITSFSFAIALLVIILVELPLILDEFAHFVVDILAYLGNKLATIWPFIENISLGGGYQISGRMIGVFVVKLIVVGGLITISILAILKLLILLFKHKDTPKSTQSQAKPKKAKPSSK